MTPLVKMHTLGHDFIPEPIHAGGLRYHGMSPLVSACSRSTASIEARSRPPARQLRGRRPVRPGRGHPARAGADPRHQGRDRRGARRPRGRRGAGDPVQPVRPRPLRPVAPTSATWTARSRTTSTRVERVEAALASLPAGLIRRHRGCPSLPAGRAGGRSTRSRRSSALFAEERRCPRCGAFLRDGPARPSGETTAQRPSREPGRRPGPPTRADEQAEGRRRRRRWPVVDGERRVADRRADAPSRAAVDASATTGTGPRAAGRTDRPDDVLPDPGSSAAILAGHARRLPRVRPDRRIGRARRAGRTRRRTTGRTGRLVAHRRRAAAGALPTAIIDRRADARADRSTEPTSSSSAARRPRAWRSSTGLAGPLARSPARRRPS